MSLSIIRTATIVALVTALGAVATVSSGASAGGATIAQTHIKRAT